MKGILYHAKPKPTSKSLALNVIYTSREETQMIRNRVKEVNQKALELEEMREEKRKKEKVILEREERERTLTIWKKK